MSITLIAKDGAEITYSRYRIEGMGATYIAPTHSDIDKDQLDLTSRKTGASATSHGNRRSTVKLVDTVSVAVPNSPAMVSKDAKIEVNVSIPVGTSVAELRELAARIGSFITNDTYLESLCTNGQIDY